MATLKSSGTRTTASGSKCTALPTWRRRAGMVAISTWCGDRKNCRLPRTESLAYVPNRDDSHANELAGGSLGVWSHAAARCEGQNIAGDSPRGETTGRTCRGSDALCVGRAGVACQRRAGRDRFDPSAPRSATRWSTTRTTAGRATSHSSRAAMAMAAGRKRFIIMCSVAGCGFRPRPGAARVPTATHWASIACTSIAATNSRRRGGGKDSRRGGCLLRTGRCCGRWWRASRRGMYFIWTRIGRLSSRSGSVCDARTGRVFADRQGWRRGARGAARQVC